MLNAKKVCAGIVSFNPEAELFKRVLDALVKQVEKVYIYDNASENIAEIKELSDLYGKVEVLESEQNDGIAKALNTVCRRAVDDGFEWILTLDHDTVICDGFIESCVNLTNENNIAIICPRVHYQNLEVEEKGNTDALFSDVAACMTSGSFMLLSAWQAVGGFDEVMFIDWVDNDICTNFKIHNLRIIRNNGIFIEHRLGNVRRRRFLFWKINDFQYSGFRIYYIVRNGIYYRRKYRRKINGFKIFLINLYNIFKFLYLNLWDRKKRKSVWKGIKDGRKLKAKHI